MSSRAILIGAVSLLLLNIFACKHQSLPYGATVVEDRQQSGIRQVFIELREDQFTIENLERIFTSYRPQCVPQGIEIAVFSNRDLLQLRINRPVADYLKDFASDEPGRRAAEKHNQQIYRPEGTLVANYSRFLDSEYYEYRMSKENIPTAVLKYDPTENPYKCAHEGNR